MMSRPPPSPPASRRLERSCVICHRRKVRCDRQSPCSQCARGKYACFYPQAEAPVRRPKKNTIKDVASRIIEIERTLMAVSREQNTQLSIRTLSTTQSFEQSELSTPRDREVTPSQEILLKKGSSSQYYDEVLMSQVIKQEHDVRSVLSTPKSHPSQPSTPPSPFNVMGILSAKCVDEPLTNFLPSKTMAIKLWGAYVNSVDPLSKVLHIPTDEVMIYMAIDDPSAVSTDTLAVCFAVYYAGMLALDMADMLDMSKTEVYESLHQYKYGLEQAFAHSDFLENPTIELLQALTIYMVAIRVYNIGRAVWTLNGLAIRAAQSIGLHRDGKMLNLSPFEAEIRRRLWWRLVVLDERAAEDYGLNTVPEHCLTTGVDLPLNVEDDDIYPEMKELPRARRGYTRMTLGLTYIELVRLWSKLQNIGPSANNTGVSPRQRVIKEALERVESMVALCNYAVPAQRMTASVARFVFRKVDLVSRQRDEMNKYNGNNAQSLAIEEHLLEAVDLIDESNRLWADELLKPYRWSMQAYRQFQTTLYVVWYLCVRPNDPHSDRALRVVEASMSTDKRKQNGTPCESKWMVIMALKEKATALVEAAKNKGSQSSASVPLVPEADDHEMRLDDWNDKDADGNGEHDLYVNQDVLDWRTLIEDFQFDPDGLIGV